MIVLCIETTCDETAAAVVNDRWEVLGSVVASQDKLHQEFGGVVPEIASRAHVERILPVLHSALMQARVRPGQLAAVAVTNTPGLAGSLLVGLAAAKALALAWNVPLVGVNHVHAHLFACQMAANENVFPCVGLVASGGHTSLIKGEGPIEWHLLGSTIDDAAGEAFDKVASLLGLGYPGGPAIEATARAGNPTAYRLPRAFLHDERLDFSFSGLKTAVRYLLEPPGGGPRPVVTPEFVADLAASFQEAVVDVLVAKTLMAAGRWGVRRVCLGGGVAANQRLRDRIEMETRTRGLRLYIAPKKWCTDNAVMGALAIERLKAGLVDSLELEAVPGLERKRS